jgi:hypothetical protein
VFVCYIQVVVPTCCIKEIIQSNLSIKGTRGNLQMFFRLHGTVKSALKATSMQQITATKGSLISPLMNGAYNFNLLI